MNFKTALFIISIFFLSSILVIAEELDSSNFQISGFNVSSGGGDSDSTTSGTGSFRLFTTAGQVGNDDRFDSTSYSIATGESNLIMANEPKLSCIGAQDGDVNECLSMSIICGDGGCVDKARFEVDAQGNPTDTLYSIHIRKTGDSDWSFVDGATNIIESSRDINDFKTKLDWETDTFNVLGLIPGTEYELRASALTGDFTESTPGPLLTTTTAIPNISFDIDIAGISGTSAESSAPYVLDIGEIGGTGSTTASDRIWIDIGANAANGANVFIEDDYTGLQNVGGSFVIDSIDNSTMNLGAVTSGFGLLEYSTSETSLGPLVITSNFDNGGDQNSNIVGGVSTTLRQIFNTSSQPINAGRAALSVKAVSSAYAPSGDYEDTVTFTVVGNY